LETYFGFVYIWYDTKRKLFYIGSHKGHTKDGYVGSNSRLMRAYTKRPETFKRKIIEYYYGKDQRELLLKEQKYLDMIKYEELHLKENLKNKTTRYYNIKPTASGLNGRLASELKKQWWDSDKSKTWRQKLSEQMKNNNPSKIASENGTYWKSWHKGKKAPQISSAKKGKPSSMSKEQHSEICKRNWANGVYDNRPPLSEEARNKISLAVTGTKRTETTKRKISDSLKGIPKSEDHKEKLKIKRQERYSKLEKCYNCGFVGSGPIMQRWHMSNCRK
jgi:hypothetical protein